MYWAMNNFKELPLVVGEANDIDKVRICQLLLLMDGEQEFVLNEVLFVILRNKDRISDKFKVDIPVNSGYIRNKKRRSTIYTIILNMGEIEKKYASEEEILKIIAWEIAKVCYLSYNWNLKRKLLRRHTGRLGFRVNMWFEYGDTQRLIDKKKKRWGEFIELFSKKGDLIER